MGKKGERKYGEATFYFESNFDVLCNPRSWNKLVKHFTLHRFHVAEERVAKVDGETLFPNKTISFPFWESSSSLSSLSVSGGRRTGVIYQSYSQ